jgi:hypothetical protein
MAAASLPIVGDLFVLDLDPPAKLVGEPGGVRGEQPLQVVQDVRWRQVVVGDA